MPRALAAVLLAVLLSLGAAAQEMPAVRIRVTVLAADQRPIPVARHVLFISDDPVTAAPRRVVTSADGTAEVRLRPGRYIAESDRPFILDARAYEWTRPFTVAPGQDATLELTGANATVGPAPAARTDEAVPPSEAEKSSSIQTTWQGSAFGVWSAHTHAAAFLADAGGLVVTSLRAIEAATVVEVQVSTAVKVAGAVIVAEPSADVAVVRVHPSAVEGVRPVALACNATEAAGDSAERYVIAVPIFGAKEADLLSFPPAGAAGGPVFSADGTVVGLASPTGESGRRGRVEIELVGSERICPALAAARAKLASAPPDSARLPMEPAMATTHTDTPRARATFNIASYQLSSSDFDVTFITPAVLAGAEARRDFSGGRQEGFSGLRVATDFENWSDYVSSAPPLLYVRVTPRLVEGFWMKLARGAASTQGAAIPPIKRLRPGFSRMRLLCGGREVTPIHPFRIQSRVTETEAIEEGFYAFDPKAVGPECGTVSLVLSSVKDPDKTETRTVDAAIVRLVASDFGR